MIERLLLLALVVALFLLAALWLRARSRALTARIQREGLPVEARPAGRPLVLAFTSPDCAPCRLLQAPALAELRARTGGAVETREFDILAEPHLARTLGVFSVPSTVLLDPGGRVLGLNIGFAPVQRLMTQLGQSEHLARRPDEVHAAVDGGGRSHAP